MIWPKKVPSRVGKDGETPQPMESGLSIHKGMCAPELLMWAIMQADSISEQSLAQPPVL